KESDWCCGSAGIYNLTNQEMAQELLNRKMNNIAETGASIIVTSNPGCMMQIAMGARQRGLELEVMHPVQLLDAAYRASEQYTVAEKVQGIRQHWTLFLGIGAGLLVGLLLSWRKRMVIRRKEHLTDSIRYPSSLPVSVRYLLISFNRFQNREFP